MPGTTASRLVEGLDDHVLVDVDAARVDADAPGRAMRTFAIRELAPRRKTRDGSTLTGPTSMPSGIGPVSIVTGMPRVTTSSTRTFTLRGS